MLFFLAQAWSWWGGSLYIMTDIGSGREYVGYIDPRFALFSNRIDCWRFVQRYRGD